VVRDPIARMQSMYMHQVSAGRERRRAEAALLDDRYLEPSLYGFQLAAFLAASSISSATRYPATGDGQLQSPLNPDHAVDRPVPTSVMQSPERPDYDKRCDEPTGTYPVTNQQRLTAQM
jgi:hypothetical protein